MVLRRGKQVCGCPWVLHWLPFCCGRLYCSCLHLSRILGHIWQWMITQVSLAVAYGGSLEIHPRSFQLMISLCGEGKVTKTSGSDECRVNLLAFFRGRAKASQAARSVSLLLALRSPRVGVSFLPLSTVTPPWLVRWGRADFKCPFFFFSSVVSSFYMAIFRLPLAAWFVSFLSFLFPFSSFFHSL